MEDLIEKKDGELLQKHACDSSDYLIAVACGAVSGLVDIFLVGAPSQSVIGKWTDAQVDEAVKKFAEKSGWSPRPGKEGNVASAIGYLERQYKVNYDQRYSADVGGAFNMSTKNHHIKSLSHSPDIIGLFFSVLNQFTSTSSFVSGGKLVTIKTESFELQGNNLVSKVFCGIVNWFGHIMSDVAGSSGSRGNIGRGSGVAIPFFELFQFCNFGKFNIGQDKQDLATLAVRAFQEGYDARFGIAMSLPVLLCELLVRFIWMIKQRFYFKKPLKECIPTQSHTDLRIMLLFGHGTLCLMDGADALVRSGGNWLMFFTRMNIIAWGRFTVLVLKEICLRAGIQAPLQKQLDAYKRITASLQTYMEQLKRIDLAAFQKETAQYQPLESYIDCIEDEKSLNFFLKKNMVELGISIPWEGDFDTFMRDKSRHLIYE